jgi:pSer/pThr/pTyr-binding forkhead associated (FHA) protein
MTFFKRMFSADYRRGVAAEAAGDYAEAARAYALAGERARVAEMHLLRAERAPSPAAKLHELRAAVRWADPEEPEGRQARRRVARALFTWARTSSLISEAERQVVRDAASLFAETGDLTGAGECHEFIGDELAAADAYQRAGDVDKLEAVLQREELRRRRENRIRDDYEEYRLALAGGERDRALEAIRGCVEAPLPKEGSPEQMRERGSYARLEEELRARLITSSVLTLRSSASTGSSERRYVGAFPLTLGREAGCQVTLRDAGISRQHAAIAFDGERFSVRDLGSKNGTTLAGVRIAGALPLMSEGQIGLGDHCVIGFVVAGETLHLTVTGGLDRGLTIVAGSGALDVDDVAELQFLDGRPRLSARGGRLLYLNGVQVGGAVQLISGDLVELGERRLEVIG